MSTEDITTNISTPSVDYQVDADVLKAAVENGVLALEPSPIGDHGIVITHPGDWVATTLDERKFEDEPRMPTRRVGSFPFSRWESLVAYVGRYGTEDSLAYVRDLNGRGAAALTSDLEFVSVVLDDHPAAEAAASRREHLATLVLRPTPAAKRWGAALSAHALDQEAMLDLVVDGLGEIAEPPGAELRELVADLHAVRTTEARSVIRSGGGAAVELADNVTLHAGVSNTLTIPESITLVLQPWTAIADTVVLHVRIKPRTDGKKITFKLVCAEVDDALATVAENIAGIVSEATGLVTHWRP